MRRCRDGGGGILYTYEPIQQITRDQSAAAPQSFSRIEIVKTSLSPSHHTISLEKYFLLTLFHPSKEGRGECEDGVMGYGRKWVKNNHQST